jgi:hypothetical protein
VVSLALLSYVIPSHAASAAHHAAAAATVVRLSILMSSPACSAPE